MEQLRPTEPLINHSYKLKLRLVHKITSNRAGERQKESCTTDGKVSPRLLSVRHSTHSPSICHGTCTERQECSPAYRHTSHERGRK